MERRLVPRSSLVPTGRFFRSEGLPPGLQIGQTPNRRRSLAARGKKEREEDSSSQGASNPEAANFYKGLVQKMKDKGLSDEEQADTILKTALARHGVRPPPPTNKQGQ